MYLVYTERNAEQNLQALVMIRDNYLALCYCLNNSCLCLQQRMWPPYAARCFSSRGNLCLGIKGMLMASQELCEPCNIRTYLAMLTHLKSLCHKLAYFEDLHQQVTTCWWRPKHCCQHMHNTSTWLSRWFWRLTSAPRGLAASTRAETAGSVRLV